MARMVEKIVAISPMAMVSIRVPGTYLFYFDAVLGPAHDDHPSGRHVYFYPADDIQHIIADPDHSLRRAPGQFIADGAPQAVPGADLILAIDIDRQNIGVDQVVQDELASWMRVIRRSSFTSVTFQAVTYRITAANRTPNRVL